MDLVVAVLPRETAGGALSPETAAVATATFREHGCVLLRGALPPSLIEDMYGEFVARFGGMDLPAMQAEAAKPPPNPFLMVGDARYDVILRMTGAFGRPEVFASPLLVGFLQSLLGPEMQLANFTAVAAHPDSPEQHRHRDCGHLFAEPGVRSQFALLCRQCRRAAHRRRSRDGANPGLAFVPPRAGVTHPMQRGDCMLMDYRTLHAGGHNISGRMRPIIYMVYARPWFFDQVNHIRRIPLDMPLERYEALPQSVRPLLIREFCYAMRTRWHETDVRADAAPRRVGAAPHAVAAGRGEPPSRPKSDATTPVPAARAGSTSTAMGRRFSPHEDNAPRLCVGDRCVLCSAPVAASRRRSLGGDQRGVGNAAETTLPAAEIGNGRAKIASVEIGP
jgi:hypothetical protein